MIHHTDQVVKPIIGNKDIEAIPEEVTYKKQYLPFEPLSAEEFAIKIEKPESEEILSNIYSAIVANSSLTEIVNLLAYFESMIISSNVAN
jgi:hypothetical protein